MSEFSINWGFLFVVFFATATLIVLAVQLSRGRRATSALIRSGRQRRRQIGRYACLVAGLIVLAVLCWSTYQDVSSAYMTANAAQTQTVRAPTMDAPAPPQERSVSIPSGRGAFYFFLIERVGSDVLVLQSVDRVLRLPEDQNAQSKFHFELRDGTTIDIEIQPRQFATSREGIAPRGHGALLTRGLTFSSSMSGFLNRLRHDKPVVLQHYEVGGGSRLSLAGHGKRHVFLVAFFKWLDPADPLTPTAAQDFVNEMSLKDAVLGERRRPIARGGVAPVLERNVFVAYGMAGGLLVFAALLFTPVFPRRWLRFAVALFVVVVFAVAIDRAVLETHRRTLATPGIDARTRAVALSGLDTSVFFKKTAAEVQARFGWER